MIIFSVRARRVFSGILQVALLLGAQAVRAGGVDVMEPWSRALPPVAANGAVYLSVKNGGSTLDRLIGASTPMAERVELHAHTMDNGMMRMQKMPALEVWPGETAVLEPHGPHLMLLQLRQPLVAGETFPLELEFERSGKVRVEVRVLDTGAAAP